MFDYRVIEHKSRSRKPTPLRPVSFPRRQLLMRTQSDADAFARRMVAIFFSVNFPPPKLTKALREAAYSEITRVE